MNNLTFGDETVGYYETIAGGAGAVSIIILQFIWFNSWILLTLWNYIKSLNKNVSFEIYRDIHGMEEVVFIVIWQILG